VPSAGSQDRIAAWSGSTETTKLSRDLASPSPVALIWPDSFRGEGVNDPAHLARRARPPPPRPGLLDLRLTLTTGAKSVQLQATVGKVEMPAPLDSRHAQKASVPEYATG
jgi:hypothetical protein